jgi:predicted PurR-regulated permease PerM
MKRKRLLLLTAAAVMVVILAVLYWMGSVLLTLGISMVIAYVLLPPARLLERGMPWRRRRPDLSRIIAIALIFLAGLGAFIGTLILVIPPTIRQGRRFVESFPDFFNSARITVESWIAAYSDQISQDLRDRAEEILANVGGILGDAAWNVVTQTLGIISGSFALVIGLATAPVLIFYLMKDSEPIQSSLYVPFPSALRPYLRDIMGIVNRTLGGYIRGQLTLGLVVGVIVAVGLLLMGVPFAIILGIVAAITELIPIIGPWIGGAAGVLVTLATAPDKVLWVILLYLVVQLAENAILVPRIQADSLKMHPIAVILVITIGSQYFGLWGIILGPPLVAMIKEVIVYLAAEWNRPPLAEAVAVAGETNMSMNPANSDPDSDPDSDSDANPDADSDANADGENAGYAEAPTPAAEGNAGPSA